jgi:L-threonylcarbamoyladenylate synthase
MRTNENGNRGRVALAGAGPIPRGDHDDQVSEPSTVLTVSVVAPESDVIDRAAQELRAGRLVAFPTETVYGLGAVATDPGAVAAVFHGKGRPATDPLIVHVPSVRAARAVVASWPSGAQRLADAFWPGPITLILPRAEHIPPEVTAGGPSVAVRVPAHPVAAALLQAVDRPVAAPSANRFGRVSPTTAEHVRAELDGIYALLLDAGPTPLGVESTVVDLTAETPRMLRPGGVTLEDLQAVLGEVHHTERAVAADGRATSAPGELLRHYAPSTPLVLVEGGTELRDLLEQALTAAGVQARPLDLPLDASDAARNLYAALRAADESDADALLACSLEPAGLGRAVNDRLFRAAHGRVVLDASPATVERIRQLLAR